MSKSIESKSVERRLTIQKQDQPDQPKPTQKTKSISTLSTEDVKLAINLIDSLLTGECLTAKDLSNKYEIPLSEALRIMSDPETSRKFQQVKKAQANIEFDAIAYDRIIKAIQSEKDGDAVYAAKTMADILGRTQKTNFNNISQTNINIEKVINSLSEEDQEVIIDAETLEYTGFD